MKTISEDKVRKLMEGMKKKKSLGLQGIGHDLLLTRVDVIAIPLAWLISKSIASGVFPMEWKRAVVTHPGVGGPKDQKYRPVSFRAAASKVFEKIVCQQLTRHM